MVALSSPTAGSVPGGAGASRDGLDVIVIGFGAAGLAAAVTATRLGASVLVLEKQPEHAHTPNTRMSGGMIMTAAEAGPAGRYLDLCGGGMVPEPVSRAWAERAARLPAWLDELMPGLGFTAVAGAENPGLEGAAAIRVLQPGKAAARLDPAAGGGPALWAALLGAARREGVEVRWNAPARRLIREPDGAVTGVEVDGGELIGARSVVLASGGYEFHEAMKQDYPRAYPIHSLGFIISIGPPGYVITDRYGRRFADEADQAALLHGFYYDLLHFDHQRGEYPRIPCYWFFDEDRRLAGPLTHPHIGACGVGLYEWSADNTKEVEAGWIHRGETIEEAAAAAGVLDPDAAGAAVREYNEGCARGQDAFGRPADTLVPVSRGPFSCVELWPGGSNTSGGPRRDARARVIDVFGAPIPGLYGAGELGQPVGLRYPSDGSNLSEALCFGQIAGAEAVKREGDR